MIVECVWEHNGDDSLLYAANLPGAYTRGESKAVAVQKMAAEVRDYLAWAGRPAVEDIFVQIVQDAKSDLQICDADSDVLFDAEKAPLTMEEYQQLKALALRSAADFYALYESIPDKHKSTNPPRSTFYGQVPCTAEEMYQHTKNVNAYYFGEIGVAADNEGTILECRRKGFEALEDRPDFLQNPVVEGSYGENWNLRKVLRRFIWHDRIHAKAMRRMAEKTFGKKATGVVAALIWDGDKFLACQRPAHKARGLLWEFAGGKVEPGETLEEALVRECREELAVELEVGDVFMQVLHEYPDLTVRLTLFHAKITSGEPQMLEHNDIRWLHPSQIPEYDFCPADKDILKQIMEQYL